MTADFRLAVERRCRRKGFDRTAMVIVVETCDVVLRARYAARDACATRNGRVAARLRSLTMGAEYDGDFLEAIRLHTSCILGLRVQCERYRR